MINQKQANKLSRIIWKLLALVILILFVGSLLFLPEGAKVSDLFVKFITLTRGLGIVGLAILALLVIYKYGRQAAKTVENP